MGAIGGLCLAKRVFRRSNSTCWSASCSAGCWAFIGKTPAGSKIVIIRVIALRLQEKVCNLGRYKEYHGFKTKDRILAASLQLFNEQGERNITTNHIAAHLDISPGNLYYHFKNKQDIIAALFNRYQNRVEDILQVPKDRPLQPMDKLTYIQSVFQGLWDYRFCTVIWSLFYWLTRSCTRAIRSFIAAV